MNSGHLMPLMAFSLEISWNFLPLRNTTVCQHDVWTSLSDHFGGNED
jgi:hypothetical protein